MMHGQQNLKNWYSCASAFQFYAVFIHHKCHYGNGQLVAH